MAHRHLHLHAVKAKRSIAFQSNDALARVGDFHGVGERSAVRVGQPTRDEDLVQLQGCQSPRQGGARPKLTAHGRDIQAEMD